jgi:predicted transcriptional regulator
MRAMNTDLPSAEAVRDRLKQLKVIDIYDLAGASGVPSSTLLKIRCGVTPNPGLETVRKFFHLLPQRPDTSTEAATATR